MKFTPEQRLEITKTLCAIVPDLTTEGDHPNVKFMEGEYDEGACVVEGYIDLGVKLDDDEKPIGYYYGMTYYTPATRWEPEDAEFDELGVEEKLCDAIAKVIELVVKGRIDRFYEHIGEVQYGNHEAANSFYENIERGYYSHSDNGTSQFKSDILKFIGEENEQVFCLVRDEHRELVDGQPVITKATMTSVVRQLVENRCPYRGLK